MDLKDIINMVTKSKLPNHAGKLMGILGILVNERHSLKKREAELEQMLRRQSEHTNKNTKAPKISKSS